MDVVGELMGILNQQVKITNSLMALQSPESSLVDKNIVKSTNTTFGSNNPQRLTGGEKTRAKEVSSIFIAKFFEEQKKHQQDSKLQTSTVQPSQKGLLGVAGKMPDLKKESGGLLGMLGKLLPWALALWGGVKAVLKSIWAGLKTKIKGILASIVSKMKNFLKYIGGKLKGFVSAIKNSKWYKAISKFVSGAISKIKGLFASIKSKFGRLFRAIGTKLSGFWDKLKSSKTFKWLGRVFGAAKDAIAKFFSGIKSKILGVVKAVTKGITSVVPGIAKSAGGAVKGAAGAVAEKGKGFFGKVASIGKNAIAKGASAVASGGKAVAQGAVKVGKGAAEAGLNASKKLVSSAASGVIKSSGGMMKLMGRLTAKGAARIPIIGPAIEGALSYYDIQAMKKEVADGKMTEAELQQKAGRRVLTGVTGMVGTAGGAALMGTLGSIIPVAGTAVGAIVGALAGDVAGRFLGGVITDHIIPAKYTKTIGAYVTGTTPPKQEMQDFIIKGDKVYPFSNKDEVMGIKTGGAIDEFMKGDSSNAAMRLLVSTNMRSEQYLKIIAQNTANMIKVMGGMGGGSGGTMINMTSPQSQPAPSPSAMGHNRPAYGSSPYALA